MEQAPHQADDASSPAGCAQCGHPVIEEGHPTPLCKDCRTAFIRYPIPKSILIFGGAVVLVLLFAMVKVPKSLSAGIHLQRGRTAMREARYVTAQKEFQKVKKAAPRYEEAEEYLAVASFHNGDMQTFLEAIQHLEGKEVKDEERYRELTLLMDKAVNYIPADSLLAIYDNYHRSFDSIPEAVYLQYIRQYPEEVYPRIQYASILFDKKQYAACDSLLNEVLGKDDTYFPGLLMKSGIKRQLDQPDSAEYYGRRVLSLNNESSSGISSLARTFLKQKRDKEGLEWAMKGFNADPADAYTRTTLALAWHFNKELRKRDQLLETIKEDTSASAIYHLKYVRDVIEGREPFRN